MIQDGGTGTTLKRVFIQQENANASQHDITNNYGGGPTHVAQQSYQLPIKGGINGQKRVIMQKANQALHQQKNNTTTYSASSVTASISAQSKKRREI